MEAQMCNPVAIATSKSSLQSTSQLFSEALSDKLKRQSMKLRQCHQIRVLTRQFPPGNGEEKHKRLSSSANADDPETCTSNKVPNNRVRTVVAKRKLSDVQSHKSGSEPCKTAKVLVSEVKVVSPARVAQSSRNANKVTVDQDLQNTNTGRTNDTVGSFCKDVMEDCSKDMQSSKTRSSRRQKIADLVDGSTDHDKENILVDSNFTSNTKRGNNRNSAHVQKQKQLNLVDRTQDDPVGGWTRR
uniref:Uncharacterized protein n=1 Tax=Zea mays TaxID=4577 RepID=A0A804MCJ7_MAIZE